MRKIILVILALSCTNPISAVTPHDIYFSSPHLVETFGDRYWNPYTKSLVLVDLINDADDSIRKESLKAQLEAETYYMLSIVDHSISISEKTKGRCESESDLLGVKVEEERINGYHIARSEVEKFLEYT